MKHFVPYEIAVMAKEAGFDEPSLGAYVPTIKKDFKLVGCGALYFDVDGLPINSAMIHNEISAPLYQQLVDWLRDKHGIYAEIHVNDDRTFIVTITRFIEEGRLESPYKYGIFDYYEAMNQALIEAFKLIKP